MALKVGISGIRGTIGGSYEDNLTPQRIVEYTMGFGEYIKGQYSASEFKVIVGRDGRTSGETISKIVCATLQSMGINVVDLGMATTPSVGLAVNLLKANGGIVISASHNPAQWNALKLYNKNGEFLDENSAKQVIAFSKNPDIAFCSHDKIGGYKRDKTFLKRHINTIKKLPEVNTINIGKADFKVVVDGINSVGGIAIPELLKALGVKKIISINCTPDGNFAHNPEPLAENLTEISKAVKQHKADLGIVVDPDVDRLALINEDGTMFGEEYTLVAVADYVLSKTKGNTVSNLSSSRALRDITEKHNCKYFASAVGEINVVAKMKEVHAVIGGEGNGGIIYPPLNYGRDALVGTALFLSLLAERKIKMSELKNSYPKYYMSKLKVELGKDIKPKSILSKIKQRYKKENLSLIDGVKIDFEKEWVHVRPSNTEPILRIYTESTTQIKADKLAEKFKKEVQGIIKAM